MKPHLWNIEETSLLSIRFGSVDSSKVGSEIAGNISSGSFALKKLGKTIGVCQIVFSESLSWVHLLSLLLIEVDWEGAFHGCDMYSIYIPDGVEQLP